MTETKTREWALGDEICDMHYGLPDHTWDRGSQIPITTRNHVRLQYLNDAHDLVEKALESSGSLSCFYTNKMAVVVGVPVSDAWYKVAYSYDCHTFVMFEFQPIPVQEPEPEPEKPRKTIFTTAEIAKLLKVAPRTVSKWEEYVYRCTIEELEDNA